MKRKTLLCFWVLFGLLVYPQFTKACSLCGGLLLEQKTFRQDAMSSKLILYGTLANPQIKEGAGTTEFKVKIVVKTDPILNGRKALTLPRYIPIDVKDPPHFLLFCDVYKGELDFFRGTPVKGEEAVDYLKRTLAINAQDTTRLLQQCFGYLEHPDKALADDAYLEFAKATDREIAQVANKLPPEKIRGWLKAKETPAERLSLYAFLLGSCGKEGDATLLRDMLLHPTEKTIPILDGILDGYIHLRPQAGWELASKMVEDKNQPFAIRFAVVRTLRFFHNLDSRENRKNILRCQRSILAQGDLADMAVADLARWQVWDLTSEVLACFDKKSHDAPIVKRAILRYALLCPNPEAAPFVAQRRKADPETVKEIEEGLQFERQK